MAWIGTSGWMYDHWKGPFYPVEIESEAMLPAYAETFRSVEVNNTFYQLPDAETVESWQRRVPKDFIFAVKANRYITHMKNLLEPEDPLANLMGRIARLGDKLGPILFQLPPGWHVNADRLAAFVDVLPESARCAFEFRHPSWYTSEILEILAERNCAFCIHDHADAPSPQEMTADFVYVRFHGPDGHYGTPYPDDTLASWAARIRSWQDERREVFAYFNNDAEGYAVDNAQALQDALGNS
jgi:uncharacterized protein YecE (DUF72 family)